MDASHCGNQCRIVVTDCQVLQKGNDLVIYGQFAKDESFINDMTTKIESYSDQMDGVQHASVGTKCLAKFFEDGHWYRAVVMDKSQSSCVVKFMDYGHDQVTLYANLKTMPLELSVIEPFCHKFILDVGGSLAHGHWTKDVAERLKSKYSYHEVDVTLHKLPDGSFVAKSPDINQCLTDWGFIGNSSVANSERCCLAAPKFSVHQKLHVSVNDVLPDGSFYCHALAMESTLNGLLDELYNSCKGHDAEPLVRAYKEQYCCAKYSDGNWYRAIIMDIDGNNADVRLVDYGNVARCNLSCLMPLKAEYSSLAAQGIHCILSADRRPQEKAKILRDLLDKPVTIEFVNIDLKPYPVRLYYRGSLVGLTLGFNSTDGLKPILEKEDHMDIKDSGDELNSDHQKNSDCYEVPLNSETPIRITYIESPSVIWIQLMDHQAKLIRLTGALNGIYNVAQHGTQMTDVRLGQVCCVKSQRTHHWCRAKINLVSNNSVEVKFLDFGYTEVTQLANIKLLKDEYSQLPCFAICCKLDNVVPVAGKWCTPSLNYLNEFVAKSGLTAKFLSKEESVYVAQIFVLAQHGKIFLNNEIVQKGFARFNSIPSADPFASSRLTTSGSSILPSQKRYYSHAGVGLVGAQVLVSICVDPTPGEFWVLPCNAKLERTFNQLTTEMSRYLDSNLIPFDKLYQGMPCVYVTQNEVLRAAIVSFEHPRSPEIFFVDIGRKMRVSVTSLRPIADEHIYFIHPLAIRCTMCGIIEPQTKFWSTSAIKTFSRFCFENNRNILCTIHACITDGTSEMSMVRISSPFKDIADILVEKGNCQYVRPFGKLFPPYSLKSYICYSFSGIGKEETFYVTHVERADLFYCQLTDNFEVIDNFMDNVQDYCSSHQASNATIQELVHAPLCFVKYDDSKWYRAHFVSLTPVKQNYATVFLVDYGNLVNVLLQNIIIFDQNSSLAEIPMQALPCCLSEIVSRVPDDAAADRVLSKLKTLILHKVIPGLVTGSTNGKLHIDLYTDALQKKRINSAFSADVNPVTALPPITSMSPDNDALLKGHYMDISSTVEVKSCHTVTVVFAKDPSDFYVRFDSHEQMFGACCNEVDGRYTAMRCQDYCVTSLNKGDIVCAKRTATLRWCRGVVADVQCCEENKVLVEFVDFGCRELVSLPDSVKKLSADLRQWPKLAIRCQLNNIQPIGENWTASCRHEFVSSCQLSPCRLRFNSYDEAENKWCVDMKVDGKSAARMLVEKKHAVYVVTPPSYSDVSVEAAKKLVNAGFSNFTKSEMEDAKSNASYPLPKTDNEVWKTKKHNYFEANKVSKVYISHVESTGAVYLQLVNMEDALETMMDKINEPSAMYKSVNNPDMSCSYLSRYDEDGRLYRVNILAMHHDGKLDIIYCDYGNRASVKSSQLYVLPKQYIELPEQATECRVSYPLQINLPQVVTRLEHLAIDHEVSISARCLKSSSPIEVELDLYKECDGSTTKFCDLFKKCLSYSKCNFLMETKLKVFVSQVDSPSQVWLQLSTGTECLEALMADIEEFCAGSQTFEKPESYAPGTLCLAKYAVDEGWYRGKIVKLLGHEAVVLFVDYGNQESVNIQNILTIDEKFLLVPQQAIQCRLLNVGNVDWTPSDIAKFVDRVSDVELVACFNHSSDSPDVYDVDLIYPCGKSLNEEWNETLPLCPDAASAGMLTIDSSEMNDTVISMEKHVVMDRGDHVIVDNVMAELAPKLDFNSSPTCEISSSLTSITSDISISIGSIEDGYVSHCEHPGLFYIQLSRFTSTLDEISEEVSLVCEAKSGQNISVDLGELCVAKCPDIGLCYRGKCVDKEDDSLSIFFVDYGNTSLVSSADIMTITPKLSTYPYLAIACKLHDLELLGDSWSNVTDSFLDLALDQELKVEFVEHYEGIWSVKLALNGDDIGECLLMKHGNLVSCSRAINDLNLASKVVFEMEVKPGSVVCIKIVNIDSLKSKVHAIQLITPKSELEEIITNWLHNHDPDAVKNSICFQNLEASSYYLTYANQKWTCIKILDVTQRSVVAIDLLSDQMIGIDVRSKVVQCPADIARMGERILLSCMVPSNHGIDDLLGRVVVAEIISRENNGTWSVNILPIHPCETSKDTTDDTNKVDDGIHNDLDEQSKLKEWIIEHLTDLAQFFEIGDTIFKDCPDCLKHLSDNLLEFRKIVLSTHNIERAEIPPETLKRLSCDILAKHQEYPAKKMKLEACKENWRKALLSKFAVGDKFEAVISSIVHPWKIFLRPYLLISELTSYHRAEENSNDRHEEIVKSKYCLVQVTDTLSNIDHWIRGEFIERDGDSFFFKDLDSGLKLEGTTENVMPVGDGLLSWPSFCMECYLTGIKPMHETGSWDTTPTNELNAVAHSLNVTDKVEVIVVTITSSDESGKELFGVDINVNKESLSKRLIAMETACPSDFDKENLMEHASVLDDLNRGSCRQPLKELDLCNIPFHSPLPITPGSVGHDLPIIDLLAVPWKVVRSSRESSKPEGLYDSVFVSESSEESVICDPISHCDRRLMTSFKIYCSNVESDSDQNIAGSWLPCLPKIPGGADDQNLVCKSTDQPAQLDILASSSNANRKLEAKPVVNDAVSPDQCEIASAEEEKKVDELAWEVVERILYNLSIEENQLVGDELHSLNQNVKPRSPQANNPESGIGSPHQEGEEESSDESHTMIDETCSIGSTNTLPVPLRDETISNEYTIRGDLSSEQQAEGELEQAIQQLDLNESNICHADSSVKYDTDCDELETAAKNLALEDSGCNVDDVPASPLPLACDAMSALTDNMQIISISCPEEQSTVTGVEECESCQIGSSNYSDISECCDAVTKQLGASVAVTKHFELTPHLLDADECTDSKNSEQYYSTESCFPSDDLQCIDREPQVGGSDYESTNNSELPCTTRDHAKKCIDASDVNPEPMSHSHMQSNSEFTKNDDVQEHIQVEGDQHDETESHVMQNIVPELIITPADESCGIESPDELSKPEAEVSQEDIAHSDLLNSALNVCETSRCNQSFGICCLPPLQINIGDIFSVSFIRTGVDPLTISLQFDIGLDTNDWQQAMIQANTPDSISRLKPCEYFESDMMCLVTCPDSSQERGRINHSTGDVYNVELIDHGEIVEVKKAKLHKLPEDLCVYPRQSVECQLHGIKINVDNAISQHKWMTVIRPYLDGFLKGRDLRAEILDIGKSDGKVIFVKLSFQKEDGSVVDVSQVLINTGLVLLTGQDESEDDGQWTTIEDSSYDELVKGSDASMVLHSSNADLSIIEEAFEEDLPEIPQQEAQSPTSENDFAGMAKSICATALASALIVVRFGRSDILG